jgi:hypothetical protein
MVKKVVFIVLLVLAVAVLEFHPAVDQGRAIIPEDVYRGKSCDCFCILDSRPWYSTLNYWFWLWVVGTPLIMIYALKPTAPKWQHFLKFVFAVLFCYGVMNLAMNLSWDIRNDPFVVSSQKDMAWQKTWDMPDCPNMADGASRVVTLLFGWLYALIYIGIFQSIRCIYRKILQIFIKTNISYER